MTPGYILLVPRTADGVRQAQAIASTFGNKDCDCHRIRDSWLVTSKAMPILRLHGEQGWVIGRVFPHESDRALETFDTGQSDLIVETDGQALIDHFWGSYVAVFWNSSFDKHAIVRDPSGALPAYRMRTSDLHLVFSDLSLLIAAGVRRPMFDWSAIAHGLRFPFLRIDATGLAGVEEIIAGTRLVLSDRLEHPAALWRPWLKSGNRTVDFVTASNFVRAEVQRAVRGLAGSYRAVQLELSGGLDSSILASTMVERNTAWRCVTFATAAADGDERRYARAVAKMCNVQLEEFVLDLADVDPLDPCRLPRVRPGGFTALYGADRQLAALAMASGCDALMSGAGGDNVFCATTSAGPVVDALFQTGVRGAFGAMRDLAKLCDTTYLDALLHSMRQLYKSCRDRPAWPQDDFLLTKAARVAFVGHPWLEGGSRWRPGRRAHIMAMLRIQPFADGYDRTFRLPMVTPLMSQPVMEACLAVPSWQWNTGGCDRALARRGFSDQLPQIVLNRRSKGRLESLFVPAFIAHRDSLHDLLVRGRLAGAGLLDLEGLTAFIADPNAIKDGRYTRILELADVELWVQSTERLWPGS